MTTREYLGQIQKYDKLIKNKKYEEEHLRSLALGLKSFSYGEKVQSTTKKKGGSTIGKN